jgi:Putative Flp pilus-assembly TadE/G-like
MMLCELRDRLVNDERGVALVWFAIMLPALIVIASLVLDVANLWEHRRHLQMQADAAALAAAQKIMVPCDNAAIEAEAHRFVGVGDSEYNQQFQVPSERTNWLLNSRTYWEQPDKVDSTVDERPPCESMMVDVKVTEKDMPWFFGFGPTPYVNAHARVAIFQANGVHDVLPVAVPDVNPEKMKAIFINEDTGEVLAEQELEDTEVVGSDGTVIWDNALAPVPITFDSNISDVGVRIVISGNQSLDCDDNLVDCYDTGSANGVLHIRGWSSTGSGAQPNQPVVHNAQMYAGTCNDTFFSNLGTSCTIGLQADVDFGVPNPTTVGAKLTAVARGISYPLTFDSTTGLWVTGTAITVPSQVGPIPIELRWEVQSGTVGTSTCTNKNSNPCKGTFGTVQRHFSASTGLSGPIRAVQVTEDAVTGISSVEQCSVDNPTCTRTFTVRVGVQGSLENASSVDDPIVALRVVGGSQNQSLDCDPDQPKLKDELARGCTVSFVKNTGQDCPSTYPELQLVPEPWNCVALQTGSATNQVPAGMNKRILGSEQPSTCASTTHPGFGPNNWADFPDINPDDPRIIPLFLTPFNTFTGSGNEVMPVLGFASFYVTGWTAQGGGFANPCQGNGDDPVPNNDSGTIVGHFIQYVSSVNATPGSELCNPETFGSCVPVLVE